MSDTIRWCFTHGLMAQASFGVEYCRRGMKVQACDVADALVIRADQDVYRILLGSPALNRAIARSELVRIGEET